MPTKLTPEETKILIDALDAWEKAGAGEAMIALLAMAKTPQEAQSMFPQVREKVEAEQGRRQEQSIMLKAKLLVMRDQVDIAGITDALNSGNTEL